VKDSTGASGPGDEDTDASATTNNTISGQVTGPVVQARDIHVSLALRLLSTNARGNYITEALSDADGQHDRANASDPTIRRRREELASELVRLILQDPATLHVAMDTLESETEEPASDLAGRTTPPWVLNETTRVLELVDQQLSAQRIAQQAHTDLVERIAVDMAQLRRQVTQGRDTGRAEPARTDHGDRDEPEQPPAPGVCPYPGLAAFQPSQAEWFFGREELTARLVQRMPLQQQRGVPLFVVGVSGVGKSSLLRAGLVPALIRGDVPVPGSDTWPHVLLTPGSQPLTDLVTRVALLAGIPGGKALADVRSVPADFALLVRQAAVRQAQQRGLEAHPMRVVLVVDQFEEIFTHGCDPIERAGFITALRAAASRVDGDEATPPALVVAGLRADFFSACAEQPGLADILQDNQIIVGPMNPADLRRAVTEPAAAAGLALGTGLVELMLTDLGVDQALPARLSAGYPPGALPLLGYALEATWTRRSGHELTVTGYRKAGGVGGAIETAADQMFTRLTITEQRIARRLLLRLIAIGEGRENTRRTVALSALVGDDAAARAVLDRLVATRLVTVTKHRVEITHEALLRAWPRLADWLAAEAADRTNLIIRQQLSDAADAWQREHHDAALLYRGTRLATANQWAQDHNADLTKLEQQFLHDSNRASRRRTLLARAVAAVFAVIFVAVGVAAVIAVQQSGIAQRQARDATGRGLVTQAESLRTSQPRLSLMLDIAADEIDPGPEAQASLVNTLTTSRYAGTLTGHTDQVHAVAFSPHGHILATGSYDSSVTLWDVTDPAKPRRLSTLTGEADEILAVAFSPDGRTLATTDLAGNAYLWDVTNPTKPHQLSTLTGHTTQVTAVAFSPDGHTLAAGSGDYTVILWNIADPARPHQLGAPLAAHTSAVSSVAFSPDGHTLAAGSSDHSVILWDVTDPATPHQVGTVAGANEIDAVAFSPNGHTLATGGIGDNVFLWDVSDPAKPLQLSALTGHTDSVTAMAFSPDGHTLATASWDKTAILWDVSDPTKPQQLGAPLTGHSGVVTAVAFSPDGRTLATGSYDKTAILWTTTDPAGSHQFSAPLTGHTGAVAAVAFSPNGRTLATGGYDSTTILWDVTNPTGPRRINTLTGHAGIVDAVAFSPDGHTLATGGLSDTVILWDVTDPTKPRRLGTLPDPTNSVTAVAFSPDGHTLATATDTASLDHIVTLWDVTDPTRPRQISTLTGHAGIVAAVAFSPDGHTLATASWDKTAFLWDVTDPARPRHISTLTGHTEIVAAVAFSPDGHTLATGSLDHTAILWDVSDRTRPHPLGTPLTSASDVNAVAFSPDGHILATVSRDHTVYVWDITDGTRPQQLGTLTGHTDAVIAVAFSPDSRTLATGSFDNTTILWDMTGINDLLDHPVAAACSRTGRGLTPDEWTRYVGAGRPYQDTCP
jgi:WD40 repeat protein